MIGCTIVTKHAKERTKRVIPSKKKAVQLAEEALEFGIKHEETTGFLNKYLTGLFFYNKTANNIRIYKQKVFVFSNNTLITILNLPYRYHSSVEAIKTKRSTT